MDILELSDSLTPLVSEVIQELSNANCRLCKRILEVLEYPACLEKMFAILFLLDYSL